MHIMFFNLLNQMPLKKQNQEIHVFLTNKIHFNTNRKARLILYMNLTWGLRDD